MKTIANIFSGSCTPCIDLADAVDRNEIPRAAAEAAVQAHYGGRVRSLAAGAEMERADIRHRDI